MSKLIALRVKEETAQALYDLATDQHRLPGQQVDVIVEDYIERHSPATTVGITRPAGADGASTQRASDDA